jgi:hypothetical protein
MDSWNGGAGCSRLGDLFAGVLAPEAIEILHRAGLRARRLEDGFPEWRLAGLPVEAAG